MNILNKISALFLSVAFLSGAAHAMDVSHKPQGYSEKFITEVEIIGEIGFQRIYITPFTSTGMKASVKQFVEEAPGVTLNGIQDFKRNHREEGPLIIELEKPILINLTSKNSELEVRIEGFKTAIFNEDRINNTLGKNNVLMVNTNRPNEGITIEPLEETKSIE